MKKYQTKYIPAKILLFGILLTSCTKDLVYFPDTVQEELEKAVEGGYDGMIVYVNQAGESSFYSAGYDDRANQTAADPHSLFKIASISKLYIAAATAKLVADGQLSLDAKLTEFIPEVDGRIEYANQITLRMMLKHRSGIRNFSDEPGWTDETDDEYMNAVALVYDKPADFQPDDEYDYSNTNYLLIAEIIDRTLGYSHHDYIYDEILTPLGLFNTYCLYSDVDSNDVMRGYVVDWEPHLRAWDHKLPGGSMVASAEDVGLFLRYLIDGTLFTDKEQTIYSSIYEYEHTGWVPGYTSIARYHPDIDAVVVQFVNTSHNGWFWVGLERNYNRIVKSIESATANKL